MNFHVHKANEKINDLIEKALQGLSGPKLFV